MPIRIDRTDSLGSPLSRSFYKADIPSVSRIAISPASLDAVQWRRPVSDPSMPCAYSAQLDQLPAGVAILCLPTAGGTTFSLQVNVNQR